MGGDGGGVFVCFPQVLPDLGSETSERILWVTLYEMTCNEVLANYEERLVGQIARMKSVTEGMTDEQLRAAPEPGVWGVGQVIGHLNMATGPYLDVLDQTIQKASADLGGMLKFTWFGKLIVKAAGPDGNAPAPKNMSPEANQTQADVMEWMSQAERLRGLIQAAKGKDLVRTKFKNPFVSVLGMNLYDGFTLLIEHNERHIRQIEERAPKVADV